MRLVLGVDAGGTASRAVLSDLDGRLLARATAGPGNPSALGSAAAVSIGTAIRGALAEHDPGHVEATVIGLAGISGLSDPAVADAFAREWKSLGLTCDVDIVGDAVTAFAAGTDAARGTVLIAGTGAVAARIDHDEITHTADGLGWLLGDEGSGLWLGLQAVRTAARNFDSPLAGAIADHVGARTRDELIHWAGRTSPATFATLAPLVCTSPDPLARDLTTRAATRLLATLAELAPHPGPVVLAGGLLTAATPVQKEVLHQLKAHPIKVAIARDPTAGATKLAIRRTF